MSHPTPPVDSSSGGRAHASPLVGILFVLFILAVNVAAVYSWLSARQSLSHSASTGHATGLAVDLSHLDIGPVWATPVLDWTLPIRNDMDLEVTVAQVYKDCACAAIEPIPVTIPPSESVDLRIQLDLTGFGHHGDLSHESPFAVELLPRIAPPMLSPGRPWRLHGIVRRQVRLSHPAIEFPDILRGEAVTDVESIEVACHPLVEDIAVEYDQRVLSLGLSRRSAQPLVFDLMASPIADGEAGLFESTVLVRARSRAGETLPAIPLKVSGRVLEHVAVVPPNIVLGRLAVGDSSTQYVRLSSRSGVEFSVEEIDVEGSSSIDDLGALSTSDETDYLYAIPITAEGPGARRTTIRFVVAGSFPGSPLELPLHISYYGVGN